MDMARSALPSEGLEFIARRVGVTHLMKIDTLICTQ